MPDPAQRPSAGPSTDPRSVVEEARTSREAQLEDLIREQVASGAVLQDQPAEPMTEVRRLIVDWGPERSEVYVGGERVGQTPYVGQVSCQDGAEVEVTVLPRVGVPLKRTFLCGGQQLGQLGSDSASAESQKGNLE